LNFEDPTKVEEVIQKMRDADEPRSDNRELINSLFNGDQPYTDAEAEENNINTNVNFLEASNIAHNARGQFNNAMLKPGNYFSVTLDSGPAHKKSTYGRVITRRINRPLKASLAYTEVKRETFAQVVLHGVGPVNWEFGRRWRPRCIGLDHMLFPSKTYVSLENLNHFALYREYTPGKLWRMTHGPKRDPGWNMPLVDQQLKELKQENVANTASWAQLTPEQIGEQFKANGGYFESDAVPTINCWDFYFKEDEGDSWQRRIILDNELGPTSGGAKWLYNPKRPYAKKLSEILHIHFGDGNNVAPFRFHSVRSLGWLLYAVCHLQNRLRCRFTDAVFESMLMYFRNVSAEDHERIQKIDLMHLGVIPEGLNIVPANERFQLRHDVIEAALSQNRQSMSDNSSSFTQEVNDGTQKEMTATETMARVNSSNALVSSMLTLAYSYETHQYIEIARRFSMKNSDDPDVQEFRKGCMKEGVPEEFLDSERWNIEPERVMGAGNKTLELTQANQLMSVRNLLDPEPAREVLHIFVEANTDDPQLAERLVPMRPPRVTDAVHDAQLASAPLMMGLPVAVKEGINHREYIETLLGTLAAAIKRIEQNGAMATPDEVVGLMNTMKHVGEHIAILAQDPSEKERVREYGDALGQMGNMVKAYMQRLQEQQAEAQKNGQQGMPPEALAKLKTAEILAQSTAKIKEAKNQQQMQHKELAFAADQRRKNIAAMTELQEQMARHHVDNAALDLETEAKILRENRLAENEPAEVAE
jgi:hypothetical protein